MSVQLKSATRYGSCFFPLGAKISALSAIVALGVMLLFTVNAQAAQAMLTWEDPNNGPAEVDGYNLYYWQSGWDVPESVDVGKQLTYTLQELEAGQTYRFAVTAYNSAGRESVFSNEVSATIPTADPEPNPTPVPTPETAVFVVNAGGSQYVDTTGTIYQADTRFSGGQTYTKTTAIAGTTDDALYQRERYGNFSYAIPLPSGDYEVILKFAELYWTAAGKRIFDVIIEGQEVLSNLDLVAKVGPTVAYDVTIPVSLTDGVLDIRFHTDVDNAKVSAIKVTARGNTPPPTNSAPVAAADTATTREDTGVTISVLANDADPDGNALSLTAVTQGPNGAVVSTGTAVLYTPKANFHGTDTFTYTVSDGKGGTATGTVAVTVTPVNDAPVAAADTATTREDTGVTISVLANDADPDGDALSLTAVTQGPNGAVVSTGTAVLYTPKANFHGTDTFTYTVSDGKGGTATGTVAVTVTPVNDAPVASNGTLTTQEDTAASGTLRASDIDRDILTFSIVTNGSKGTATLTDTTTGTYTYTPHPNATGTDTFIFQVKDGTTHSNIATVTVTISSENTKKVVFAVNAGGPAYTDTDGTVYQADTSFSGGQIYTKAVAISGTEEDVLYQSERYGNFAYTIPLPNGDYVVTLKFAEIFWTAPGKRVFDVEIEDTEVLHDLDLVTKVGPTAAYDVTVPVSVTDGVLDIYFFTGVNNAKVSAIVVETLGETQPPALEPEVVFAVNVGGPAYTGTDGTVYQADTGFSGGKTYTRSVAVAGTEDDVLYQSERYGDFAYAVPVPNGDYVVTLKFAEIFWTAPGQRVFDVEIEGLEVLPDLDLVAKDGPTTAYDVAIPVLVTDGVLDIHFFTDVNNAKVSAIVVETLGETL